MESDGMNEEARRMAGKQDKQLKHFQPLELAAAPAALAHR
jgi:hypothetical protein